MQDLGCQLPRIPIPRTRVNRGSPDSSRIHRLSLSCARCCMQEYTGDHGEANKGAPFNFEGAQLKEDWPGGAWMRFTPRYTGPVLHALGMYPEVGLPARSVEARTKSKSGARGGSGQGQVLEIRTCPKCDGRGSLVCETCHGDGYVRR